MLSRNVQCEAIIYFDLFWVAVGRRVWSSFHFPLFSLHAVKSWSSQPRYVADQSVFPRAVVGCFSLKRMLALEICKRGKRWLSISLPARRFSRWLRVMIPVRSLIMACSYLTSRKSANSRNASPSTLSGMGTEARVRRGKTLPVHSHHARLKRVVRATKVTAIAKTTGTHGERESGAKVDRSCVWVHRYAGAYDGFIPRLGSVGQRCCSITLLAPSAGRSPPNEIFLTRHLLENCGAESNDRWDLLFAAEHAHADVAHAGSSISRRLLGAEGSICYRRRRR